MAHDCVFTAGSPNVIKIYAPTHIDIIDAVTYTVYITTAFADGGLEGIEFGGGIVRYPFFVEIYPTGASLGSAAYGYLEEVAVPFPYLDVVMDSWTQNEYTRIRITWQITANIAASSDGMRIVIELPTDSDLFLTDLGLGLIENDKVPCNEEDDLTGPLDCYFYPGAETAETPNKIVVSGFGAMSSTSELYTIHLPKLYFPPVGGDDKQISIIVYALDISSGWPGIFFNFREIKNVARGKTNTVAVLTNSNAPSVSGNTAGSTGDYTFPIDVTLKNSDFYIIEFPSIISMSSVTPTCEDEAGTTLNCYYYKDINAIYVDITGVHTDIIVRDISNPPNPIIASQYLHFRAEHWSDKEKKTQVDYPLLVETFGTPASPTITVQTPDKPGIQYYQNDYLEYEIALTTGFEIPSGGCIAFDFPPEFPDLPESTCRNVHSGFISRLKGDVVCTVSGKQVVLTGFDSLVVGDLVQIKVLVQHPSSSLTTSAGIIYASYTSSTVVPANILETVTSSPIDILSDLAPMYYEFPRQLLESIIVHADDYAPLKIILSDFGDIIANTGFIKITLPTGFGTTPTGSELVCLWNKRMSRCFVSGQVITVYSPENSDWNTYPFILTITSTNADSIDTVGIQHPSVPGEYGLEISSDCKGDGTLVYQAIDYVHVFPNSHLATFTVNPAHYTASATNLFSFTLTTTQDIPLGGFVRIYFPTEDMWGNQLFEDDLGTGLADGQYIPCQEEPSDPNLVSILDRIINCKLYLGSSSIAKPAYVEMTNFDDLSGIFTFVIWGIKNPANSVPDAINIEFVALTLDADYSDLDYFYLNYGFTVTSEISSDPGTPANPHDTPTVSSGTIGATVTIDIELMDNSVAITAGSSYILEIPSIIPLFGIALTDCTIYPQIGLIHYTLPPAGAVDSYPILSVTTNSIIPCDWGTPVITCTQISNKVAQRDRNPYLGINSLTPMALTTSSETFSTIKNEDSQSHFSFTVGVEIPNLGLIKITYPTDYQILGNDCELSGLQLMTNFKCSIAGQIATIQVYELIPVNTVLTVNTYLLSKVDDSSDLSISTFCDESGTIIMETGTFAVTDIVASPVWPLTFQAPPQTVVSTTATVSEYVEIRFKVRSTLTINYSSSQYLRVALSNAFLGKPNNAALYCTIDACRVPCEETTANSEFSIYASSTFSITANDWHEVIIYTNGGDSDTNGYELPTTALTNTLTVTVYDGSSTETEARVLSVPTGTYAVLNIRYLHTTKEKFNVFSFTIEITQDIDGTAGESIVIEFPLTDYNMSPLFRDDLGTGKIDGDTAYCDNLSLVGSTCTFTKGNYINDYPAKISITGFNSVSALTQIQFDLPKIANPRNAGPSINVSIRVASLNAAGIVKEERTVEYLFKTTENTVSTCTVNQPVFGSYITDAITTLEFSCCSSQDLTPDSFYILEFPSEYTYPVVSPLVGTSDFETISKRYKSANWIQLSSSATVDCSSGSPTSTFDPISNPSKSVPSGTLIFKSYSIFENQMTDEGTYDPITFNIAPAPVSTVTTTTVTFDSVSINQNQVKSQTIITAVFSSSAIIPADGKITLEVTNQGTGVYTDPYFFTIVKGVGSVYHFDLSGTIYSIKDFISVAASEKITVLIPVLNPDNNGGFMTVTVKIYDDISRLMGTGSVDTSTLGNNFAKVYSIRSHTFRFFSLANVGIDIVASFEISLSVSDTITSGYNYVVIDFDDGIQAMGFGVNGYDNIGQVNGIACAAIGSTCLSAI